MNPLARAHTARIRAFWKVLHAKPGEGAEQLIVLEHDEAGDGGLIEMDTVAPGKFFLRAKEDPLQGNLSEVHITLDALSAVTYKRAVAFEFKKRRYARKDRHPDIEEPAGLQQFYAFVLEPKEIAPNSLLLIGGDHLLLMGGGRLNLV